MAEGFARKAGWQAFSAGIKPELKVNPFAVKVMAEVDIDISHHTSQSVNDYLLDDFHIAVTVCDYARESCPVFRGNCEHQIHHGFKDPAYVTGNDKKITEVYRGVRDEIQIWMNSISVEFLNNKS